MSKPILLWRHNGELSPRQPDVFEPLPSAVSEQMLERLLNEGREVYVLEFFAWGHAVLTERLGPPLWSLLDREVANEHTNGQN